MFNQIIYHYNILKVLGTGKSGTTYLAKDLDSIDSPFYLVKQLAYDNLDPIFLPLIERSFEVQGTIAHRVGQHSQIPSLIAKFEADGHKYLVYEYIDGELLSQELTPGSTWSQAQVLSFLIELIEILSFIHPLKYIHQNINPQHIIRRKDNTRLTLIGFSAVRDLENNWYPPNYETHNLNDPSYTSYEQAQNVSHFNSDLYAVGTIAIQALTGKFPIEKDSYSHELKWRDEVTINHKLIEIINRMVRPDYRNRYRSASEVLQDLKSFELTQLPRKSHPLKPQLIFGTAITTLLLGFGGVKLFTSANQPQVLSSVATINPPTVTKSGIWNSYVDKTARISVKYPATWHQQDIHNVVTGENVMFTNPKSTKYRENISIRIENLTNPQTTLASYTRSTIAEINKYYQGVKIIQLSSTILAKRRANLVVYTGKDENSIPIEHLEVWTIDRGKAYILTYKAKPDRYYQFLGTALRTIDSFELK